MNKPDHPPEPTWLPPPGPDPCLVRAYSSSPLQKGGTLIAEDVIDLVTHARRMCDPDGYRPPRCPRCDGDTLHAHGRVERKALGNPGLVPILVALFRCACEDCQATWRVLPAFIARHLWYSWRAVEMAILVEETVPVPARPAPPTPAGPCPSTITRWRDRLAASARLLVQVFATLTTPLFTGMIASLVDRIDATRGALVAAYATAMKTPAGRWLATLAGHVHRVSPGLRLM